MFALKTLTIGFIICFLHAGFAQGADPSKKAIGRVVTVQGNVVVRGQALKAGDSVFKSDVIVTDADSAVKLLLDDRTVVDISPSSSFKISEFNLKDGADREVDATLDFGQVRSLVSRKLNKKGRFNFRTRGSVLAVRGTEFYQDANPSTNTYRSLCSDGKVWTTTAVNGQQQGNGTVLTPGKFAEFKADGEKFDGGTQGMRVASLNKNQMSDYTSARKVRVNTFTNTVTFDPNAASAQGDNRKAGGSNAGRAEGKNKSDKKPSGSDVLDTIKDTVDSTVLGDKKVGEGTPPVDTAKLPSVPGLPGNTNPIPPINNNEPMNQIITVKIGAPIPK